MQKFVNELFAGLKLDISYFQIVSDISVLPISLWMKETVDMTFFWISSNAETHPCKADDELRGKLEEASLTDRPSIFFENEYVFYGVMRIGKYCIAVGPASRNAVTQEYENQYAELHKLTNAIPLRKTGIGELTRYMALLFCHFYGRAISYEEVAIQGIGTNDAYWESQGDLAQYQLEQSEYDRSHGGGEYFETQLISIVKKGDVEAIKKLMGGEFPDMNEVGTVAQEERKQLEYLSVSLLTLLTRAAIEGGLRSEIAHELGDVYLKRLASVNANGGSYTMLGLRAMYEFTDLVHQAREERRSRSHIETCKDYIEKNLRKNLKVGDIAPAIGLSRTYLAHLFRNAEGITVQQYIQREKCHHAANLLKYSDHSIALIAEYFGFSSQSYFGVCFQHWYGVTPSEYRRINFRKLGT